MGGFHELPMSLVDRDHQCSGRHVECLLLPLRTLEEKSYFPIFKLLSVIKEWRQ